MDMRRVPPPAMTVPGVVTLEPESLKALCGISPYPLLFVDDQGSILKANPRAGELFGYPEDDLVGQPIEILIPEPLRSTHQGQRNAFVAQARAGQRLMRGGLDVKARDRDGNVIPVQVTLVPVDTTEGRAVVASVIDLRPRKALENQLRDERDLSDAIIHSLPGVFYLLDHQGRLQRWNQNLEHVTERSASELAHAPAWSLFDPRDAPRVKDAIDAVLRDGAFEIDAEIKTPSGSNIPFHFTGLRVVLAGQQYVTGAGIDISTRKALEADLRHQANHDALTGLVNRHHFESALRDELTRSKRYDTPLALIMMDIDRFKTINDRFGHPVGDQVLCRFAEALKDRIRATDTLARWGGEEFMILLPQTDIHSGLLMAEALRTLAAETPMPGPGQITLSAAVTVPRDGEPEHELLSRLDAGLYRAKRMGRNRVVTC